MARRIRRKRVAILAVVGVCLGLFLLRPADRGLGPPQPGAGYQPAELAQLGALLRREAGGLPCAVVDLDRLDRNIARARQAVAPSRLRIVAKSLPSIGLLRYILARSEGRAVMVFDAGQLALLLKELPDTDVLLGKPVEAESARPVLVADATAATRVQWLIDSERRLRDYLAVAQALGLKLRVSVELDIGLRRGGVHDAAELSRILDEIAAHPAQFTFSGFMGYDGHVPFAPAFLGPGKDRAVRRAFADTLASYQRFVDAARARHPEWFSATAPALTIHSGGSRTVTRYTGVRAVVNDLSLGSGLVKPSRYDDPALAAFEPGLLLGIPILKQQCRTPLPFFFDGLWGLLTRWDRNLACGFFLYGSTWDGDIVWPQGLAPGYYNDGPIRNLLPNQQLLTGSTHVRAAESDYVLIRPGEADILGAFGKILAVRGDKIEARWEPLPHLN